MFDMFKPQLIAMLHQAVNTLEHRAMLLRRTAYLEDNQEENRRLIRAGIWEDVAAMVRLSIGQ